MIRAVTILVFTLLLLSCDIAPESMFRMHVIDPIPASIKDIQYMKDRSAIHGPLFFRFEAKKADIEKIIEKHKLKRVATDPLVMKRIINLPQKKVDWWKANNEMNRYSIWYTTETDFQFRYLYEDKNTVFFITTGNFNENDYKRIESFE